MFSSRPVLAAFARLAVILLAIAQVVSQTRSASAQADPVVCPVPCLFGMCQAIDADRNRYVCPELDDPQRPSMDVCRGALFDEAQAQNDCAGYALYLERCPASPLRPVVEAASLGLGCAGTLPPGHRVLGETLFADERIVLLRAPSPLSWQTARGHARALGGDLAAIVSAAENETILRLLTTAPDAFVFQSFLVAAAHVGPWIGLYQEAGAREPAGGWRWVSGEPLRFTAWKAGEPNDLGGETFGLIYCRSAPVCAEWNDGGGEFPFPAVYSYLVAIPLE